MEEIKAYFKSNIFLYIMLALFCFLLATNCNSYDYDLFARLIVGENFIKTGSVAYQDFLSYTETHPWFDHEWGAGVIFYLFLKFLGPAGLILIHFLTMFFTLFFILKTNQIQKHAYPISIAIAASFLMLFNHLNPSIVRCQMFTFMFYAMTLYLLEKTRNTNSDIIWMFIPIAIFWNNIHGGIASGLGMIFIYMISEFIQHKNWIKYLKVLIVSTLVLLINPYGISYLSYMLFAYSIPRGNIAEWQNIFTARHLLYYCPILIIIIFTSIYIVNKLLKNKNFNLTKFIAILTTLTLGILHVKLLTISLITIASLYSNEIINLISKNSIKLLNKITYISILISVFFIQFTSPNIALTNFNKFPIKEVEFLKVNKIKGNILTDFELGSYVSYKLYPQNLIYMDGRFESVYNDKEFQNLINFENVYENWDNAIVNYPTEIVIFQKDSISSKKMEELKDWKKIYQGDLANVFAKKTNKYIDPPKEIEYYQKTIFDTMGYFGKK